jgi:predicted RNA-binding protein YlxR (DUF448 family)
MRIAATDQGSAAEDGRSRRAVHDRDGTMPGRGAYLCRGGEPGQAAATCVELALRRGGIARALRCAVTVEDKLVESVSR